LSTIINFIGFIWFVSLLDSLPSNTKVSPSESPDRLHPPMVSCYSLILCFTICYLKHRYLIKLTMISLLKGVTLQSMRLKSFHIVCRQRQTGVNIFIYFLPSSLRIYPFVYNITVSSSICFVGMYSCSSATIISKTR
jgi:hypothetical protein